MEKSLVIETLDEEWLALIEEAKQLGLNKEEVRTFLLSKMNGHSIGKTP